MSTLADKFHDSFDAYYAGKQTGWCSRKAEPQPESGWRKKAMQRQEQAAQSEAQQPAESRHQFSR